jgi:chorismate dehydratase
MPPIRIGCVKYLNTLPMIEGLEVWRDAELATAAPAELIGMLLARRIDIGLLSVVDAARASEELALLPVGMIGSDGPTLTVRLFSSIPFDQVRRLHADTDSHTSVALAQVVLDRLHGREGRTPIEVVPFDAARRTSGWPETVLLIGDKVATDPPPLDDHPHRLDLGQAWRDLTGLPFVYAVWMCRAAEADSPAIRAAAQVLDRQRRHNATRLDWLVSARAADRGWQEEEAREYLGRSLKFAVGPREREAAAAFLDECARLGLVPARPRLRWADV